MKVAPVLTATINDQGQLKLTKAERSLLDVVLSGLRGKSVKLTVKELRHTRSLEQNAWHWAVGVPMIAEHLGYERHEHEEVHYWLVATCFGTHRDERINADVPNVRSSKLTTKEFSDLMEWEVRFAAKEWGLVIPLPDEARVAS